MSEESPAGNRPIELGPRFTASQMFEQVFRQGMDLVEETANYLDGAGREQSRRLGRTAALAYATESMRLTTRLMQIASWLLIQRAVADGEMSPSDACSEQGRVPLKPPVSRRDRPLADDLPEGLRDLMARTDRIYARLYRLDQMLSPSESFAGEQPNPVVDQIDRLRAAFDIGSRGGE